MSDALDIDGWNRRTVSYADFRAASEASRCCTASRSWRPSNGEVAWVGDCSVRGLLMVPLFPVWFVDMATKRNVQWDHPRATRIRFVEAMKHVEFRTKYLREWTALPEPRVVVLECSVCRSVAVIDGNHRLATYLERGMYDLTVVVHGLSGSQWRRETPDMGVMCVCR